VNPITTLRSSGDLVPVTDRLRALSIWRGVVLSVAVLAVAAVPSLAVVPRWPWVGVTLAFLVGSSLLTRQALQHNQRIRELTSILLLGDSVAIVLLSLAVGGPTSPLRYLVILQAVEVTLMASFRTGLRLVVWQSLVVSAQYVVGPMMFPAMETLRLTPSARVELIGLLGCSWIAAITTAALAAANERELRRRRYDLEKLAEYHGAISDAADIDSVTTDFVHAAVDEFEAARVVVALPGAEGDLVVQGSAGVGEPPVVLRVDAGSLLAEAVEATGTQLILGLDPATDGALLPHFSTDARLVVLPIRTPRGRGLVIVEPKAKQNDRVERRVISMLERYRDELESRVSNLWLVESLRTAATTDPLTGLANRGWLREALHAETQKAIRTGQPLCVVILDVDHFKKVNDVHGHAAGDVVLRQVAAALKGSVRPYDLVARYGGEEFVVLIPGLDLADATALCERLRLAVAGSTSPVAVTISLGLARFDPAIDDEDHVIARADELLYEAKQGGRNQVRTATQLPFTPRPAFPPPLPQP